MFALMLKELRSLSRVIALALLADGWLLSELTEQSHWVRGDIQLGPGFALAQTDWLMWFGFLLAVMASIVGLSMSLDDGLRGTWAFALFRPVSRRAYIGTKLLVGGAVTLALSVLPVVVYSVWAARPGNVAAPFRWSQLQPAIEACGWSVVVFLGAFLSGIRPAKWWWSRLWPLVTTITLGMWFWLAALESQLELGPLMPTTAGYWGVCVAMLLVLSVSILSVVEEREFA
ncbi:MAG: hypothetical protein ACKV2Q_06240 [Planctomycetaceae bacterium]